MMTRFDTYIINKLDYFSKSLDVLKRAEFEKAKQDKIYRMGVFCQFNLTFELAWKALQAVLRLHGAERAETGSPRELLQLGYKLGFVDDAAVWLLMLKKHYTAGQIHDGAEGDGMLLLTRARVVPAVIRLRDTLKVKAAEAEVDWN